MTSARESRIGREAAEWVVKFDGVEFDARDVRAFRRWLAKSPDHRAAFEFASTTWNQLDLLARLETFPLPLETPAAPDRRALLTGAAVAVVAIGAGGVAIFGVGPAEAFETGVGEVREVALSDGTAAILNADTRIEARIGADARAVRVIRGEALFSIAGRGAEPLRISTPAGGVEAIGGDVLVKVLPDGARVSLMSEAGRAWRAGLLPNVGSVAIEALSEIELGQNEVRIARIEAPLLSRRTLWREGRLAFDDTPLSEAVADVSRQTGARFVFADPALADLRIGGLIDGGDLNAFLALLHDNLAVRARLVAGEIVLSSSSRLNTD